MSGLTDATHQGDAGPDFGSLTRSTNTAPTGSSDDSEAPPTSGSTPDTWQPSARAWQAAAADRARLGTDGTAHATDKFRRYRTAAGRPLDDGAWVSWLANERPGTAGPADARGGSSLLSDTTLADRMAALADALADDDRTPPHPRAFRDEPRADVRGHAAAIRETSRLARRLTHRTHPNGGPVPYSTTDVIDRVTAAVKAFCDAQDIPLALEQIRGLGKVAALAAVTRPKARPAAHATAEDHWETLVVAVDGGHLEWTGARASRTGIPVMYFRGRSFSPARIAFRKRTGRDPVGHVRVECGHPHCLAPDHLDDDTGRTRVRAQLAAMEGRRFKDHCTHGHDQAEHRRYSAHGKTYCNACRQARKAAP
ncbi:hypothetical protein ACU686_44755 [Yinghuangia aomiensis]